MDIGIGLRKIRFEKGLNQQDVATKAKISQTYLSSLENGKKPNPSYAIIGRLCKVYNVPYIVIAWYSLEESDIKPKLKESFKNLKPAIDNLIHELVKS